MNHSIKDFIIKWQTRLLTSYLDSNQIICILDNLRGKSGYIFKKLRDIVSDLLLIAGINKQQRAFF